MSDDFERLKPRLLAIFAPGGPWDQNVEDTAVNKKALTHKDGSIARLEIAVLAKASKREQWTRIAIAALGVAATALALVLK